MPIRGIKRPDVASVAADGAIRYAITALRPFREDGARPAPRGAVGRRVRDAARRRPSHRASEQGTGVHRPALSRRRGRFEQAGRANHHPYLLGELVRAVQTRTGRTRRGDASTRRGPHRCLRHRCRDQHRTPRARPASRNADDARRDRSPVRIAPATTWFRRPMSSTSRAFWCSRNPARSNQARSAAWWTRYWPLLRQPELDVDRLTDAAEHFAAERRR